MLQPVRQYFFDQLASVLANVTSQCTKSRAFDMVGVANIKIKSRINNLMMTI